MNNVRTFWINTFRNLGYLNPPGLYITNIASISTTVIISDSTENCTCRCGCTQVDDSFDKTGICISCLDNCTQSSSSYVCSCCSKEVRNECNK